MDRLEHLKKVINEFVTLDGLYCEFGVAGGQSIEVIAGFLPDKVIHGFDWFGGLPERWTERHPPGTFKVNKKNLKFKSNVRIYDGLFEDTLYEFVKQQNKPLAFGHIDCDLYSSTVTVLDACHPLIVPGTVLVFDEFIGEGGIARYVEWREHEYKAFHEYCDIFEREWEEVSTSQNGQVAVRFLK